MSQSEQNINFLSYKNLSISNKKNHLNIWMEDGSLVSVSMRDIVDAFLKDKKVQMQSVEGHTQQVENTESVQF